jgi:hypothetical protein
MPDFSRKTQSAKRFRRSLTESQNNKGWLGEGMFGIYGTSGHAGIFHGARMKYISPQHILLSDTLSALLSG